MRVPSGVTSDNILVLYDRYAVYPNYNPITRNYELHVFDTDDLEADDPHAIIQLPGVTTPLQFV